MKTRSLLFLFASALLIASCNQSVKKAAGTEDLKAFTAKLDSIVPSISKPSQAVLVFQLAGVDYNKALVLDPQKWETYTQDSILCAANMGVYIADAMYQYATENKDGKYIKQDMYLSIAAATSLARSVGMETEFKKLVIGRYEDGAMPADSIINMLDKSFRESNVKASENSTMRFFMALAIGNHIEKEFILLHSIIDNPNNLPDEARLLLGRQMMMILKHQLGVNIQLTELAESLKNESDPGVIIPKLQELNKVYTSVDFSIERLNAMTPTEYFNNPRINEIYSLVKEMRSLITKQN
jgi:hypothetical protein